ncbi:MAG: hypothetical protein HF978_04440 [Desulfobacteraceae bacterium]|nr:hypothetical protein [Desulfobacteraceae bacterium]MBC2754777.1 hypothetical protein [Desulfobacteraceae bacterium]
MRNLNFHPTAPVMIAVLILTTVMISVYPKPNFANDTPPAEISKVFTINDNSGNSIKFKFGGIFQVDYRYYTEDERADNRFLVRRSQIEFTGWLNEWLKLNIEYELKDIPDQLLDTYAEVSFDSQTLRIGHFKKPFSLEVQNAEDVQYFAERSMGVFLGGERDVGVMLHGSLFKAHMHYAGGLFNAETDDVANRGDGHDAPELVGRLVFSPFVHLSSGFLKYLQVGASASYAKINLGNLDFKVKTSGMIDTNRYIYVLSHDTKFGVLQDADARWRIGAEAAWAWKSLALQGEYVRLTYTNLKPAGDPARDADFATWYISAIYFLTGEQPEFCNGILKAVPPIHSFNLENGKYGGLALALRVDHFDGDKDWIHPSANVSVDNADGYSIALNWLLLPVHRIILDYTYTDLSDPIRVRVHPDGSVDYINKENVVTLRYSIDF